MSTLGQMERVRAIAAHDRVWAFGGVRTGPSSAITVASGDKSRARIELDTHTLGLALTRDALYAACADGTLRAFSHAGTPLFSVSAHVGGCNALALLPGGKSLVTAGADGAVRRWALPGGAPDGEWKLSHAALSAVAVDPSGETFGAAGSDGVVRSVAFSNGARREMLGHQGPVHALAFTPHDGRSASAGDDGIIRLWYLVGAVEFEARGADNTGHEGAVHALAFAPPGSEDGKDLGDRLYSAGADGKVKIWRLDDRKRTAALEFDSAPARAIAFAPAAKGSAEGSCTLLIGYDDRIVWSLGLLNDNHDGESSRFEPLIDELNNQLWSARPAREAAVRALAEMDEPEAIEKLCEIITDNDIEQVRILAIEECAARGRRKARPKVLEALSDGDETVQRAAFDGLRVFDGPDSVAPMQAALGVSEAPLKVVALTALGALGTRAPAGPSMVLGALGDDDPTVRLCALAQWLKIQPDAAEALRVAYEKSAEDMRREVLVHAACKGLLHAPALASTVARALDDDDADVRRTAFAALVMERRALCRALEDEDPALKVAVQDLLRRAAQLDGDPSHTPTEKELRAARKAIAGVDTGDAPTEDDKGPLVTAIACRSAETALWGASGLAVLGDLRALGALLQLSREPSPELRRETAAALARLHDGRARKRLEWMFDDEDADVRAAARTAYGTLDGVDALKVASVSLRASQPDIRVQGLSEVVKLGRSPASEALLEDALEDESNRVRAEAFRAMWAWHGKSPEAALTRCLNARFGDVRLRAVEELASLQAKPWARPLLVSAVKDRDESVATRAFTVLLKALGENDAPTLVLGMTAHAPSLRARAAAAAVKSAADGVLPTLKTLLDDERPEVRAASLQSIDTLAPGDNSALRGALASKYLDLRVQAAEALSTRHDDAIVEPMRELLADKALAKSLEPYVHAAFVTRAARALATLGSRKLLDYFSDTLLKHEAEAVREQGARGLAMAARAGDENYLLDALSHGDVGVRSWAADGLSRLGDTRALPVLTGNQKHDNQAVRFGAILSFAALGEKGLSGMLLGLEDPSREGQEAVFSILLARDLRANRAGEPPELLVSALSSLRPEVRYAAARAIELRGDPERYLSFVVEALTPATGERATTPKGFPPPIKRARLLVGLADALAGDIAEQRYAAAQVLLLRREPERYFREVERVVALRAVSAPWQADTGQRKAADPDDNAPKDWLRRLFSNDPNPAPKARTREESELRQLAFGAYVGLLRQAGAEGEGHRVRRDTIDRLVELSANEEIGHGAVVAALKRALEDPHHLVRKAAFDGLRRVFPAGAPEPLAFALLAASEDVGKAAVDQLGAQGAAAIPRLATALNSGLAAVRWHAFQWIEKLSPAESLEPLLMALSSDHADLRIGVIERLAGSKDPRVIDALVRATASDREDLRLRAAELLARRRDERAIDPLAAFLRADDEAQRDRAIRALATVGTRAAVETLSPLLEDSDVRDVVVQALIAVPGEAAIDALVARFDDEDDDFRVTAYQTALSVVGSDPERRNDAWALRMLREAVRAKDPELRRLGVEQLAHVRDHAADGLVVALFTDRVMAVRQAAVQSYDQRVLTREAPVGPMEQVLRDGVRELVLPAAEALAFKAVPGSLQTLLLVARAGEPEEQPRAILALGSLGDPRALAELETLSLGGTVEAPVEMAHRVAAIEALGRIAHKLTDAEARARVIERVEQSSGSGDVQLACAGVRGLRWIGGERARSLLESVVRNRSAESAAREAACEALGAMGDALAEESLAWLLQDASSWITAAPYQALRKLFPSERTRVELAALKCSDSELSERAASYLSREGAPVSLVERLPDLLPELRRRLLFGLLRRGAAPVSPLAAMLAHAAPDVRADAAWLVGARVAVRESAAEIPWSEADRATLADALAAAESSLSSRWPSLPKEQRDMERAAWEQMVWALGALHAGRHTARLKALAAADPLTIPAGVSTQAARALARTERPVEREKSVAELVTARDVDALLRRLAAAASDADRRELLDALGRIGDARAKEPLAAMAFDKKSTELPLRKAAYRALRRVLRSARRAERVEA